MILCIKLKQSEPLQVDERKEIESIIAGSKDIDEKIYNFHLKEVLLVL